jgi:ElaB/YqjD/DUF883 family membrane-anchored ribosome-binding protein
LLLSITRPADSDAAEKSELPLKKGDIFMDDYNKQPGQPGYNQSENPGMATAARMKLSDTAADVREKVADIGRRAADSIDSSRLSAASTLDGTASALHSSADQISDAAHTAADKLQATAHSTADKLQATADYFRQTDLKGMVDDLTGVVKRYPGQSLAAAAILGFVVARGLRSND